VLPVVALKLYKSPLAYAFDINKRYSIPGTIS